LVAVAEGRVRELIRRETISDLLSRDSGWVSEQTPPRSSLA